MRALGAEVMRRLEARRVVEGGDVTGPCCRCFRLKTNPSEVPHSRQNGRLAIGELSYQSGTASQLTSASFIDLKAIDTEPVARWHIRQWHR